MDTHISRWILEFFLRQPIEDRVVNTLLSILPLPNDDRLMKTILLRRISSEISNGSISEKILESLEMIEELDHKEGKAVLDSMQEAYCAVAVDCAVKFLRENSNDCRKYFDAVIRIWRGRICDIERWGSVGLVSDQLRETRDEIEAAVWSVSVRNNVTMKDTRSNAFKSVKVFLVEAVEEMGPSFLESAAEKMYEKGKNVLVPTNSLTSHQVGERQACPPDAPHEDLDVGNENVAGHNGSDMDLDSSMEIPHAANNKYNLVPTPEIRKVQEALKSSSLDLRAMVKDPLPDALRMAATISSNMAREEINYEHSVENQNVVDMDVCIPSVGEGVEAVHTKEVSTGNQNGVLRPSIMTRNSTARTYEWGDDSIESSHEGSPNRPHLPTPKNRVFSPLRQQEVRKITRRRKFKKWSSLEEQTLRDAVKEYGKGNWSLILDNYRETFEERTTIDLKDKWRNMTR